MSNAVDAPTHSDAAADSAAASGDSALPLAGIDLRHLLGTVRGDRGGPTLVCVGGLHGNEPAGVLGMLDVLARLGDDPSRVRGEFVALAGNVGALAADRRYLDRDLNRAWTEDQIASLSHNGQKPSEDDNLDDDLDDLEDREQRELLAEFEAARGRARGQVWVVDLHTTSGPGGIFTTVSDRLPNREFALAIPAPLVLGLEEMVDGTLMDYLDREGLVAMSFESGQHREPKAVERAAQGIWLALAHAGVIDADCDEVAEAREALTEEFAHLPDVVEMRYRHGLEETSGFNMLEGYQSFQPIRADELLGQDERGDVRAPRGGRILMPLYQEQGDDGFFIVREFSAFWLGVSERMRRWGFDRFVHLMPGVRRVPSRPGALYVNRRVARWFALELLHLLGYRRVRDVGQRLIVIRRGRNDPSEEPRD